MPSRPWRRVAPVILACLLALLGLHPPAASAYNPGVSAGLWFEPLRIDRSQQPDPITGPSGSMTFPCRTNGTKREVASYNKQGLPTRLIDGSATFDGRALCFPYPPLKSLVDKNDVFYALFEGATGIWILAFDGNKMSWSHKLDGIVSRESLTIGSDGNLYVVTLAGSSWLQKISTDPVSSQRLLSRTQLADATSLYVVKAFSSGLMLRSTRGGSPAFYDLDGRLLRRSTIVGDSHYESLDTSGMLVTPKLGKNPNGTPSGLVSLYDYRTDTERIIPVSLINAEVSNVMVQALPDRQVAIRVREQTIASMTNPQAPKQYTESFVIINTDGRVTTMQQLGTTCPESNSCRLGHSNINATSDGYVTMVRDMTLAVSQYPYSLSGIEVSVFDPRARGSGWISRSVLQGNLLLVEGLSIEAIDRQAFATGGAVNFVGRCYTYAMGCGPYREVKSIYSVRTPTSGVNYPQGAVLASGSTRAPDRSVNYVALGDSFSSGEGNPPFSSDPAICHQSLQAYPWLLARDPFMPLKMDRNVTCSGATTVAVLGGWHTEGHDLPLQVSALNAETQYVTITIGGNDIHFSDFARECVLGKCDYDSGAYQVSRSLIDYALPKRLEDTYRALLHFTEQSQAHVYVLGYPHVIAEKTPTSPLDTRCQYMYDANRHTEDFKLDPWQEADAARQVVTALNGKIEEVVNKVAASTEFGSVRRLHFVSATGPNSPFNGHGICDSGTSYFQNVDQAGLIGDNAAYVFHPNTMGQKAYAQLIKSASADLAVTEEPPTPPGLCRPQSDRLGGVSSRLAGFAYLV